jgi:hypothetical protein
MAMCTGHWLGGSVCDSARRRRSARMQSQGLKLAKPFDSIRGRCISEYNLVGSYFEYSEKRTSPACVTRLLAFLQTSQAAGYSRTSSWIRLTGSRCWIQVEQTHRASQGSVAYTKVVQCSLSRGGKPSNRCVVEHAEHWRVQRSFRVVQQHVAVRAICLCRMRRVRFNALQCRSMGHGIVRSIGASE